MTTTARTPLVTLFHGGRTKEVVISLAILAIAMGAIVFTSDEWFIPAVASHLGLFVIAAILSSNSLPIVNYHISAARWFISGIINVLAGVFVLTAIAMTCIVFKPTDLYSSTPFDSYIVRGYSTTPCCGTVMQYYSFGRLESFVLTAMVFVFIYAALGLSGMAVGAIHRTYGVLGAMWAVALSVISIVAIVWIIALVSTHSPSAPWPGAILFSIPPIIIGLALTYFAARKKAQHF